MVSAKLHSFQNLQRKICALPFAASGGCLHSLAYGHITKTLFPSPQILVLLLPLLPYKEPYDYISPLRYPGSSKIFKLITSEKSLYACLLVSYAVITNHHKAGDLKQSTGFCKAMEIRSLKSRFWQSQFFFKAIRKYPCYASLILLEAARNLWCSLLYRCLTSISVIISYDILHAICIYGILMYIFPLPSSIYMHLFLCFLFL